ncbi:MAG: histidine kinase dimerization/phosphoacceptor domain-containing protein [Candidatus Obscuribacterales bacterium]|nr:histidine kinase dimerization/phosphoacceptor domain-containing protein [Candidatus Obscuribacterales bacterium]
MSVSKTAFSQDPIAEKWQSRLRLIQIAMISWLMLSQIALLWIERLPVLSNRCLYTLLALALAALCVLASAYVKKRYLQFCIYALEYGALFCSALYGQTSGFELAWLVTLARVGLSVPSSVSAIFFISSIAAFFMVTLWNHDLVVQASANFVQSQGVLGAILGREFVTYLIGLLFISVLVHSIRTEQTNRRAVEQLTEKLDLISKELERNRIAREINDNVDNLLVELSVRTSVLAEAEIDEQAMAPELGVAKELASQSLKKVREALNLLRHDSQ